MKWSPDYLRSCFHFVDGVAYWGDRPREHFKSDKSYRCFVSKLRGKPAGRIMSKCGYVQVLLDGHRVLMHRLVMMMHGHALSNVVDHIDGNPQNNRIENLRHCTQAQNARNNRGWKKRALFRGVYKRPNGNYTALIRENGRPKSLGTFNSYEDAIKVRLDAELRVYGEFSGAFAAQHGVTLNERDEIAV